MEMFRYDECTTCMSYGYECFLFLFHIFTMAIILLFDLVWFESLGKGLG